MGILVAKKLIAGIVAVLAYTAIWIWFYLVKNFTILFFLYKWLSYAGTIIYALIMVTGFLALDKSEKTFDELTTTIVVVIVCLIMFFVNKTQVFGFGVPIAETLTRLVTF